MGSARQALIIGGTGMLAGCTERLAEQGWRVALPSRRPRERQSPGVVAVRAEWSAPELFAERVADALSGPVELLVSWVHTPWREPVLRACERLLTEAAPTVEVWASASADPVRNRPEPVLARRGCHQVLLGFHRMNGRSRWLTNAEISEGVYLACLAAIAGEEPRVHAVGQLRPWSARP
ncbi:hypothetical protein EV191_109162 [Tamaricihabitans halophyticus]|uniref:Short subunit dehydrogenase n=1 Tax=Tamaricihabitans halophyticus TaxID=1262583 RepID=A0A4R2QIZ1_9PSEU|nr:hypothetical protein [Tamaricihabitans halophyticus]TCP49340.1 hypothetical protein EV191_109162 [Tamaricihabitans halophyticus]